MEIQTALVEIAQDKDQPRDADHEPESLSCRLNFLEFCGMTILDALTKQVRLQKKDMDLAVVVT